MAIPDGWFQDRAPVLFGIGSGHTGMASDTEVKFYGLWHLIGETVQATIAGIDMGDYTVDTDGAVTIPLGSDGQGIVTAAYLASLDNFEAVSMTPIRLYIADVLQTIHVPVVIGKQISSKGQSLRPTLGEDLGIRPSTGLGKKRRSHAYAVLLNYAVELAFGTDFTGTLDAVTLTTADGETVWPQNARYAGVYRGVLTDQPGYDTMLCWQVDRPVPAMVCAFSTYIMSEE